MGSVVEIAPLTRVEGHGSLKVFFEGRNAERVELSLSDSPRLFESLLLGKSWQEVPEIVCRICSLCSTVHKVTALLAVEKALGIEVTEPTALTRELITNGGMIQDHALHLYCLVLPDLLQLRGVAELARESPELLRRGLNIKRIGNLIQETVGGRLIHPVNIQVAGLGQRIERDPLLQMKDELLSILPACRETIRLFETPFPFPRLPAPRYLALHPCSNGIWGEFLGLQQGSGFPVGDYREHVVEKVLPFSHAKHVLVEGMEPTVGALARLNLGAPLGKEADSIFDDFREKITGEDIRWNNLSQAIGLFQAVERSLALVERLLEMGGDWGGKAEVKPTAGTGAAACEAPRGVLIHSYDFDAAGICTRADVITPTALNQGAMARDLLELARNLGGADGPQIKFMLERLIRCYDPCISCSVHLVRL